MALPPPQAYDGSIAGMAPLIEGTNMTRIFVTALVVV